MALIPPFFLDCVVALGERNGQKLSWLATGFLYGKWLYDKEGKSFHQVFLITNRHVVQSPLGPRSGLVIRCNPEADDPARDFDLLLLDEKGNPRWDGHPDNQVDVVAIPLSIKHLREEKMRVSYFSDKAHVAPTKLMKEAEITEGDDGFVLGFPMGLVGKTRNTVIVRRATIARLRETMENPTSEFLVDATVFPGNSGGPVITHPEFISIEGTKSVDKAYLIGIVAAYVPYRDVAVSAQTQQPRVIFEENSGLAACYSVDCIQTVVELSAKRNPVEKPTPESLPPVQPPSP